MKTTVLPDQVAIVKSIEIGPLMYDPDIYLSWIVALLQLR